MEQYTLCSKRLGFRPLKADDLDALRPILGDEQTMYAWEYGFTDEQILGFVDRSSQALARDGYAYHAAFDLESGELVGLMGLISEYIHEKVETGVGYIMSRAHWGKGYATEGAQAWLDYGFNTLNVPKIIADIRPANLSSIAVAKKLGMVHDGEHVKIHNGKEMLHLIYTKENPRT